MLLLSAFLGGACSLFFRPDPSLSDEDDLLTCHDDSDNDNDGFTDCQQRSCLPFCEAFCGDGALQVGEQCEDLNTISDDGCDNDCTLSQVLQIEAGSAHTCALLESGAVSCWGRGVEGQLGYGNSNNIGDDETPLGRQRLCFLRALLLSQPPQQK